MKKMTSYSRGVRGAMLLALALLLGDGSGAGRGLTAADGQERPDTLTTVTRIEVRGARSMKSAQIAKAVGISAGGEVSGRELSISCSRLLRLYGDAGFPWAQVQVFVRTDANGQSEVLFAVDEGRRARVGELGFTGNTITRREVLARQAGVREGDQFSLSGLEDARMRLAAWDMYDEVGEIAVHEEANPYRIALLVPVVESKPHNLTGMIGFGPGQNGESRLWGNASFLMKNIMGTARRLELRWSQSALPEKFMRFSYREPWLGKSPVSGEASFSQRVREGSFTQIELGAAASAVFSGLGRLGLGFGHELLYPQGEVQSGITRSTKESLLATLSYRHPAGEARSSLVSLSVRTSLGLRRSEGTRTRETIIDSDFESIVWAKGTMSVRILGGARAAFTSDDLSPSYLTSPFGGAATVRGHRDGELYVMRALWAQSELSLRKWGESELHVFYDQALAATPRDLRQLETTYLSGYGAGISAGTGVGRLRLDLALAPGKGFGRAMLHVGIREEF